MPVASQASPANQLANAANELTGLPYRNCSLKEANLTRFASTVRRSANGKCQPMVGPTSVSRILCVKLIIDVHSSLCLPKRCACRVSGAKSEARPP
jgi:hypothetical protein